jgi:hypothetical protein
LRSSRSAGYAQACGARQRAFLSLPSIYEPARAQNRARADSTCWATFGRPFGAGFS